MLTHELSCVYILLSHVSQNGTSAELAILGCRDAVISRYFIREINGGTRKAGNLDSAVPNSGI